MNKKGRWSRKAIDAFLAKGGDIKSVDKFLLKGGQIPSRPSKVSDTIGYVANFGDNWHFGRGYSEYLGNEGEGFAHDWQFEGGRCPSLEDYDGNGSEWFYENWRGKDTP